MTVMRKNAVFIISLLGLALPSCANPIYRDYVYSPLNNDPFVEIQKDGFYRIGDYDSYESNGHEINMDFSSIYQLGNVRFNMPTVGEVPLLVTSNPPLKGIMAPTNTSRSPNITTVAPWEDSIFSPM